MKPTYLALIQKKLANQRRKTERMLKKRCKHCGQKARLVEISPKEINKIKGFFGDVGTKHLSFDHLFKDGEYRIVFQFGSKAQQEADPLLKFLKQNGFDADLKSGLAKRDFTDKMGNKRVQQEKIGKLLQKFHSMMKSYQEKAAVYIDARNKLLDGDPYGEKGMTDEVAAKAKDERDKASETLHKLFPNPSVEMSEPDEDGYDRHLNDLEAAAKLIDFWNKKSEFYRTTEEDKGESGEYTMIISRHPIDVLRMSDFQGISSCHSPGASHYKCALAEAKGEGLVAYVVRTDSIPKDFDFQKSEIFKDKSRNVEGLLPLMRVRLRKYSHEDRGDMAIPEERIYGKNIPGAYEALMKWARKAQKNDFDDIRKEKPDLSDFTRHGGSYQDNPDDSLFNNFFDTDDMEDFTFKGRAQDQTSEEEEDEEEEDHRAEQYEDECYASQRQFDNQAEHTHVSYSVEEDEDPYVSFWGGASLELPKKIFVKDLPEGRDERALMAELRDEVSSDFGGLISEIEVTRTTDEKVEFRIDLSNEGYDGADPDSFGSFCRDVLDDLDKKWMKFEGAVKSFFNKKGYAKPSSFKKKHVTLSDLDKQGETMFKNIDVYVDRDDDLGMTTKESIQFNLKDIHKGHPEQLDALFKNNDFRDSIITELHEKFNAYLKILRKQLSLPVSGMENPDDAKDYETDLKPLDTDDLKMDVSIDEKKGVGLLDLSLVIWQNATDDKVDLYFRFFEWLDKNVQVIPKIVQAAYDDSVKFHGYSPTKEISVDIDISRALEKAMMGEPAAKAIWEPFKKTYLSQVQDMDYNERRITDSLNKIKVVYKQEPADAIFVRRIEEIFFTVRNTESDFISDVFLFLVRSDIVKNNVMVYSQKFFFNAWFEAVMVGLKKLAQSKNVMKIYVHTHGLIDDSGAGHGMRGSYEPDQFLRELLPKIGFVKVEGKDAESLPSPKYSSAGLIYMIDVAKINESVGAIVEKLVKSGKVNELVKTMKPLEMVKAFAEMGLSPRDASLATVGLLKKMSEMYATSKMMPEPEGWPYDGVTISIMDPKNKTRRHPINNGIDRELDPLVPTDGTSGGATQQKSMGHFVNGQDWSKNPQNRDFDLPETKKRT